MVTGVPGLEETAVKERGYRRCLAGHGLEMEPGQVQPGFYRYEESYRAAGSLLKLFQPDAILAVNDLAAIAALTCALATLPEYLLMDEVFDGLDPVMRQLLKRVISERAAERQMTVVIASHNLRELEDFCDHVGLIHKGGVLFEQELDELKLGIHKVQAVYRPALDSEALDELRDTLDIIKLEIQGSMVRFVARGSEKEIDRVMQHRNTIFYETLPLSLEEVFISEMEAAGSDLDRILS